MDALQTGDVIVDGFDATSGRPTHARVVAWLHHDTVGKGAAFIRLSLSGGRTLVLTPNHFVPIWADGCGGGGPSEDAHPPPPPLRRASHVQASAVRPGHGMAVVSPRVGGGGGRMACAVVTATDDASLDATGQRLSGLFNPLTSSGKLVVDGVLVDDSVAWPKEVAALLVGDGFAARLLSSSEGVQRRLPLLRAAHWLAGSGRAGAARGGAVEAAAGAAGAAAGRWQRSVSSTMAAWTFPRLRDAVDARLGAALAAVGMPDRSNAAVEAAHAAAAAARLLRAHDGEL